MLWHKKLQNWEIICTFQLRPTGMLCPWSWQRNWLAILNRGWCEEPRAGLKAQLANFSQGNTPKNANTHKRWFLPCFSLSYFVHTWRILIDNPRKLWSNAYWKLGKIRQPIILMVAPLLAEEWWTLFSRREIFYTAIKTAGPNSLLLLVL